MAAGHRAPRPEPGAARAARGRHCSTSGRPPGPAAGSVWARRGASPRRLPRATRASAAGRGPRAGARPGPGRAAGLGTPRRGWDPPAGGPRGRRAEARAKGGPFAEEREDGAALLAACSVGLLTGAGVVALNWAIHGIQEFDLLSEMDSDGVAFGTFFLPVLGGLYVSALTAVFGDLSANRRPTRRALAPGPWAKRAEPFARTLAAAVTLGTGNSLGPEGPSVDIGRAWGKFFEGSFGLDAPKRARSLQAAGSAAGISAGFNAALSGVFFAVESQRARDADGEPPTSAQSGLTLAMVLLASVLAAVVSQAGLGAAPAFVIPRYETGTLLDIPLCWFLGVLSGVGSISFLLAERKSRRAFDALQAAGLDARAFPAVGALCVGLAALEYPEITYQGWTNFNSVLLGGDRYNMFGFGANLLLQFAALKIALTAICRGSGLVGGSYAPALFIGASLGFAFGDVGTSVFSHLPVSPSGPQLYALVGMASTLAGVCRVPLTSILLIFELTRDYGVLLPTLGSVALSYFVVSLGDRAGVLDGGDQAGGGRSGGRRPAAGPSVPTAVPPGTTLRTVTPGGLPLGAVVLLDAERDALDGFRAVLTAADGGVGCIVGRDGRALAVVRLEDIERDFADRGLLQGRTCADVAARLAGSLEEGACREADPLQDLRARFRGAEGRALVVLDDAGAPAGALSLDRLEEGLKKVQLRAVLHAKLAIEATETEVLPPP